MHFNISTVYQNRNHHRKCNLWLHSEGSRPSIPSQLEVLGGNELLVEHGANITWHTC